jgi:hypothetical protein
VNRWKVGLGRKVTTHSRISAPLSLNGRKEEKYTEMWNFSVQFRTERPRASFSLKYAIPLTLWMTKSVYIVFGRPVPDSQRTHVIFITETKRLMLFRKIFLLVPVFIHDKQIFLMKQQFVVTHRHTILQEAEKTWQILNRPTLKHVMFLRKYKAKDLFFLWTQRFDRRYVCNPTV